MSTPNVYHGTIKTVIFETTAYRYEYRYTELGLSEPVELLIYRLDNQTSIIRFYFLSHDIQYRPNAATKWENFKLLTTGERDYVETIMGLLNAARLVS